MVTDAGLQHQGGLTALQMIFLSYCEMVKEIGLQHLSGLAALQTLHLSNYEKVIDAGLQHLGGLSKEFSSPEASHVGLLKGHKRRTAAPEWPHSSPDASELIDVFMPQRTG
jgi:hypothetical protein